MRGRDRERPAGRDPEHRRLQDDALDVRASPQDGKRLVGHLAKRQAITNARNTVYAAKRLIGRRFDSRRSRRSAIELCPYEIVQGPNDDPRIESAGKTFTCPEIAGIVLREMKRVAEEYLGETGAARR